MISRFTDLTIGKKILLLGILMSLPYIFVSYRMISEINNLRLDNTRNEIRGVEYLLVLRKLTEATQAHRGMLAAYINGDSSFKTTIIKTQIRIQNHLKELSKIHKRYRKYLGGDSYVTEIENQTKELLKISRKESGKSSFLKHTGLIAKIHELNRKIGDTSSLILDPNLNTFYLMDITLVKLPETLELMGQARGLSSGIAARGKITKAERDQIFQYYVLILRGQDLIEASLRRLYDDSPQVEKKLTLLSRTVIDTQKSFLELLKNEFITPQKPNLPASKVFQTGSRAMKASYAFYDQSNPLLREILKKREKVVFPRYTRLRHALLNAAKYSTGFMYPKLECLRLRL